MQQPGCHGPFRDKTVRFSVKTNSLSHGVDRDCPVKKATGRYQDLADLENLEG